ncbi:lateral root primordium (LRP) protein-related [Striga asiatica]|uniref:Lateral root primordium (LRP) protein-related n=1 Tax=Striga asiatica TaxID=4170 RepID=A0A5A7Q773_STRAF|nr:lateral root primordium (LRP) protein-related [Striga asiatica]
MWKKQEASCRPHYLNHICSVTSIFIAVATTRRLASDNPGDWVASSTSPAAAGDLSLGFNAGTNNSTVGGMWPSAARHVNCGLPPEFFFVAPASSFHHQTPAAAAGFDPPQPLAVSSAMVGVIPLLTAATADEDLLTGTRGSMQLWQNPPPGMNPQAPSSSAYLVKPVALEHATLLQAAAGDSATGRPSPSLAGPATCQDCGNQAKKDCSHRRCRTCCKSRGYDCATHVKSTWVPAARRRERQLLGCSSQSTSGTKKPRLGGASQTNSHTSTSNTTPPRSFDTTSSHQGVDASLKGSLPGQVRAPAVFKCVRVTSVDDGEDEYAYQAIVRIGGHVFKGFLYDQGVDGGDALPNLSELNLGGGATSSPPVNLEPSDQIYGATSGGGLLGGSSYGNPIN